MKIRFLPSQQEIVGDPNKTLLQSCVDNGVHINSVCKGVPKCAECRVKIVGGEHNVLPPTEKELSLLGTNWFLDGRRLSCQVRAFGDITVDLTEQASRDKLEHKKTRGFRDNRHAPKESTAVLDTFVLQQPKNK